MENQDEKPKFPVTFDKCPVCGSTERITDSVKAEEVAKGKLAPDAELVVLGLPVPITDQHHVYSSITIPMLMCLSTICAKCGAVYCVSASRQDGQPKFQPSTPPGPTSPFMNRTQRRHPTP